MKFDCIIAGGGVVGLSLAYHLAKAGQRVFLFEREALPGCHASGKNSGMFRHLYRHEKLTGWAERSRSLWPTALSVPHFVETGSLVAGRTMPNHHGHLFENVELAGTPAVLCREDGLLDSPAYIPSLHRLCRKLGVGFLFGATDYAIRRNGAEWTIASGNISASAPYLVNAAGAWACDVLCDIDPNGTCDVQPYARHLFLVDGWPNDFMPAPECGFYWDEAEGWYLRRWDDTTRLFSICDAAPADPDAFTADESVIERAATALIHSFPHLSDNLRIARSWHCFRTYAPDQLPVIGLDPVHPGLFWMAGFGGFGMSTSFGAAEEVASFIAGKDSKLPSEFAPGRIRACMESSRYFPRLAHVS